MDQLERDIKTAIQFIRIVMNLFADITTLDVPEPLLMATLEMIEKAVCSLKKITDVNIEHKEFERICIETFEVIVVFRDQMIKKRTMFNQEQWPKNSKVNLITDTLAKNDVCISFNFFLNFDFPRSYFIICMYLKMI